MVLDTYSKVPGSLESEILCNVPIMNLVPRKEGTALVPLAETKPPVNDGIESPRKLLIAVVLAKSYSVSVECMTEHLISATMLGRVLLIVLRRGRVAPKRLLPRTSEECKPGADVSKDGAGFGSAAPQVVRLLPLIS